MLPRQVDKDNGGYGNICDMFKNAPTAVFAFAVIAISVIACGWGDGQPAAEQAIKQFHTMLDDERYAEIYAGSDPKLKEVATEKELLELLQAIHIKLGKVTATKNSGGRLNKFLTETQIVMVQETEFERGKATETFTFIYADKKASLAGYHVNSNDLILK